MLKLENHLGTIDISREYITNLVGITATSCFGVAAMATAGSSQTFLKRLLPYNELKEGIRVRYLKAKLLIDVHIIVGFGTNISAIVESIIKKVRYTVEEMTGFPVAKVNVFVDGMKTQ